MSFTKTRIVEFLKAEGEATKTELADECCRTTSAVCKALQTLRADGLVYIKGFINIADGTWNLSPVYALGSGDNATPPSGSNCVASTFKRKAQQQGVGK